MKYALYNNSLSLLYLVTTKYAIVSDFGHSYISTMEELHTYTDTDFTDLSILMQELSGNIVFTRESLERMLAGPNSHLYVIREGGRIVACACLCIYHQPFSTDATIESVVVSSKMRGKGLGRKLMEHLIEEASRMNV